MSRLKHPRHKIHRGSVVNFPFPFAILQDISARSPVKQEDPFPSRISLDSRTSRPPPRSVTNGSIFENPQTTNEDQFEEVGLNDEVKSKKWGIFSRFGDSNEANSSSDTTRPSSSHRGFHIPGRKRGHSGQGAELGSMDRSDGKDGDD